MTQTPFALFNNQRPAFHMPFQIGCTVNHGPDVTCFNRIWSVLQQCHAGSRLHFSLYVGGDTTFELDLGPPVNLF